jgi:hypothetical protein
MNVNRIRQVCRVWPEQIFNFGYPDDFKFDTFAA